MDHSSRNLLKTLLYFVLLTAVFWGPEFFAPSREGVAGIPHPAAAPLSGTPLEAAIDRVFAGMPLLGLLVTSVLVFFNAFFVSRVVLRNVAYLERTYTPAIVYLLISSGYYNSYMSFRPLLVALLVLMGCELLFKSYHRTLASGNALGMGFLFGLAAAIYAPAILLAVLLPIGWVIFRMTNPREWAAGMVGWALPLFFTAYAAWLAGGEFMAPIRAMLAELGQGAGFPSWRLLSGFEWMFIGCLSGLLLLSFYGFLRSGGRHKLQQVKVYLFFVWMLLAVAGILLFAPCRSLYQLPILAIPLAVIIPSSFSKGGARRLATALYLVMIGCAVAIHLLPLLPGW